MLGRVWMLDVAIAVVLAAILVLLYIPKLGALFEEHVRDRPKRRLLLAAIGFFSTFLLARAVAYAALRNVGPFHYIYFRGTHIHHLVWGILLLLIVGFCWLIEVGTGEWGSSLFASRLLSLLYGVGAALTLDELSIWLNLREGVYWTRHDLISIDAVILFGVLLLIAMWGKDFLKALGVELWKTPKRRMRGERRKVFED
jgi:hypothetical protein